MRDFLFGALPCDVQNVRHIGNVIYDNIGGILGSEPCALTLGILTGFCNPIFNTFGI